MTFDQYLRSIGFNRNQFEELRPDRRERIRATYQASIAASPPAPTLSSGSTSTGPGSAFDPQGQMDADYREDNPFASYSSLLGGQGLNTSAPQASAFHQWVNNEGWSGIENDYKTAAAKDPWDAPAMYDWMASAQSPTNFTGVTGIKSEGGLTDTLRLRYNQMTPQQRGVNSATGFKPGRWAVF